MFLQSLRQATRNGGGVTQQTHGYRRDGVQAQDSQFAVNSLHSGGYGSSFTQEKAVSDVENV
jgi:hypothetical protein